MRLLCVLILGVAGLGVANVASAERYATTTSSGKGVVAHTRLAPVLMHRALPPYGLGKHVYAGRAK